MLRIIFQAQNKSLQNLNTSSIENSDHQGSAVSPSIQVSVATGTLRTIVGLSRSDAPQAPI